MSLFTSSQFASAAANGTDWRDTSKKVLELLEQAKTSGRIFNFGFLYISDHLADEATSIYNLFRSVLNIENWIGTVGLGVCGNGESFIDTPAISAMIGYFAPDDFCIFPGKGFDVVQTQQKLKPWLDKNDPMLVFVHGDPMAEEDPMRSLKNLEQVTGGFLTGGLSSSRKEHFQFAETIFQGGLSGAVFSQNIRVASTLSQGCTPIGPPHVITRGDDHVIRELDSEKAVTVFENDLRSMAIKKIDVDPHTVMVSDEVLHSKEAIPEEFRTLFKGEVHVAFPVSGSDRNDYLVRNIIGLDAEDGTMMITQSVANGENIIFVHRDDDTVQEDLSKSLVALCERVRKSTGGFEPRAALYVSCVARAFSRIDNDTMPDEMKLIRNIIGDVPLAGFYAGGEINNARLYGYTGILTLFL